MLGFTSQEGELLLGLSSETRKLELRFARHSGELRLVLGCQLRYLLLALLCQGSDFRVVFLGERGHSLVLLLGNLCQFIFRLLCYLG